MSAGGISSKVVCQSQEAHDGTVRCAWNPAARMHSTMQSATVRHGLTCKDVDLEKALKHQLIAGIVHGSLLLQSKGSR